MGKQTLQKLQQNKTFQVPAVLVRVYPMKDGGISLGFYTQELMKEEKVELMEYFQQFGYLLFRPNEFKDSDVPTEDAHTDETRTPSQRLRSVIYVLSQQKGIEKQNFNQYYRKTIEKLIEQYKDKLEL